MELTVELQGIVLLGLLAVAGGIMTLAGLEAGCRRGQLGPAELARGFRAATLACAALAGLSVAQYVLVPSPETFCDAVLGVALLLTTARGALCLQRQARPVTVTY
jgi:hypothetical protein